MTTLRLHRGIPFAGFCAMLMFVASCGIIPQEPYAIDEPVTVEGTEYPAGSPVYLDAQGAPTMLPVAPDGTPHKRATVDDAEKVADLAAKADKVTSNLPWGLGGIAALVTAAGVAAVRARRKQQVENIKGKLGKKA